MENFTWTSNETLALVFIVLLIAFNAFLGAAETSLTRASPIKLRAMADEGQKGAERVLKLLSEPTKFLNVILLTTLVDQLLTGAITATLVDRVFGNIAVTLVVTAATLVLAVLTFIFGESMPKTFAIEHPERVALFVAPVTAALTTLVYPVAKLFVGVSNILLPGAGKPGGAFYSEQEIRTIVDTAGEDVEAEERRMIHSIFDFGDTIAREVMTPRPDMVAIPEDGTLDDVMALIVEHGYSRIPIYSGDTDTIVGLAYAKDVLRRIHENGGVLKVREIMRPAHFVPEQKRVSQLLHEMQEDKFHMAVVVDEHGGTAGLITLEDLLEEIVGEIADEYDVEEAYLTRLDGDRARARGRLSIDDLNDELGLKIPNDGFDTVGGLVLHLLGRVPEEGESVEMDGLTFTAERVIKRRVLSVIISGLESVLAESATDEERD